MRPVRAAILAAFAVSVLIAIAAASDSSDAGIDMLPTGEVMISGDNVLDHDMRFRIASTIVFLDGASLDVSAFTLSIGQSSVIAVPGSASVSSSGGKIVFEGGGPLVFDDGALLPSKEDVTVTFDGTAYAGRGSSLELGFTPRGTDPCIHVEWGNHSLALDSPSLRITKNSGTTEIAAGFSQLSWTDTVRNGNALVRTDTTTVTPGGDGDALDIILSHIGGDDGLIYLKSFGISSVSSSTYYAESDVTVSWTASGFHRLDVSLGAKGEFSVSSEIDEIETERSRGGIPESRTVLDGISWEMNFDLARPFRMVWEFLMGSGDRISGPDVIKGVSVSIDSVSISDFGKGTEKNLSGFRFALDREAPAEYRITIVWRDGDAAYRVTSSEISLDSFGISTDLMMDLGASVSEIRLEIVPDAGPRVSASLSGLELEIRDLDLAGLFSVLSRTGELDIQQILDNCQLIRISASSVSYSKGARTVSAKQVSMALQKDERKRNAFALSVGGIRGSVALDRGGSLDLDAGKTSVSFTTDGSLAEYMDALAGTPRITSDSELSLHMEAEPLRMSYSDAERSVSVSGRQISPGQPEISLDLTVKHSVYRDSTRLDGSAEAPGIEITAGVRDRSKGIDMKAVLADPDLALAGIDLGAMAQIREESGSISPLDIADSADSIVLSAGSADVDYSGAHIGLGSLDFRASGSGRYAAGISGNSARLSMDGNTINADRISLSLTSSLPFSDLQKAAGDGFRFNADASISFDATLDGASARFSGGSVRTEIGCSGSPALAVGLIYERSERWGRSVLDADIRAAGYDVRAEWKNGSMFSAALRDPEISIKDLDADAVGPGNMDILAILDSAGKAHASASYADIVYGGYRIIAGSFAVESGSSGMHIASAKAGSLSAAIPSEGGSVNISSGALNLKITSDAPFADIRNAIRESGRLGPGMKISAEAGIEDLGLTYSGDAYAISVAGASGGSRHILALSASAARPDDGSGTLMDAEISASGHILAVDLDRTESRGSAVSIRMADPYLRASRADIDAMVSIYKEAGGFSLGMLDCLESARVKASGIAVGTDGAVNLRIDARSPDLTVVTAGGSGACLETGAITAESSADGGKLKLSASSMAADMASGLSFGGIEDLFDTGRPIGSDAKADISLSLADLTLTYSSDSVGAAMNKIGAAPRTAYVSAAFGRAADSDRILLGMDLTAEGYFLSYDSTGIHYGELPLKGDRLHAESSDIVYSVTELDLTELSRIFDETKEIKLQQILDSCGSLSLSAGRAEVEWDGDGKPDAVVRKASAGLSRDGSGVATVTLAMDEAAAEIPVKEQEIRIRADATELSLSSDIPFSELVELILGGLDFRKDTNMGIVLTTAGMDIDAGIGENSISLEFVPAGVSSGTVRAEIALEYSLPAGKTSLGGKLDATGFRTLLDAALSRSQSKIADLPSAVGKGSTVRMELTDLTADMSGFDIAAAYRIFIESGPLTAQQIIDCSDRMGAGASGVAVDIGADGDAELSAENAQISLGKNKGQNSISFGFDGLRTMMEMKGGELEIQSGASEILLFSEGSLSECISAFLEGADFTSDTRAELHVSNETALIEYRTGKDYLTLSNGKLSERSPRFVTAVLSMEYSEYRDQTALTGKISSIGHSITVKDRSTVKGEDGIMYLTLRTEEISGGFEAAYGKDIGFSANLYMPWSAEFSYYDVQFRVDCDESVVSLTNGSLSVDGYDHKKQGLLAVVPAIKSSDFSIESRVLMSSESLSVTGSDPERLISSYGNAEIDIKKVSADMKRGDTLSVTLEDLRLSVTDQDGKVTERTLKRLDITKDQSGAEPGKSWVEKNSLLLAAVFIAASVAMIAALILHRSKNRRPPESER